MFPDPRLAVSPSNTLDQLGLVPGTQEADKIVWYSHLFKNFPQFVVIHTVKGFSIVNEADIDVFLEFSCFFNDPMDVGNLISGSSTFSKSSLNISKFLPHFENFEHYLASMWSVCNCVVVWIFFGFAFLWNWNENWPFITYYNLKSLSVNGLWIPLSSFLRKKSQ